LPKSLSFIGVGDYPGRDSGSSKESPYRQAYLSYEGKGCRFFTLERFQEEYAESLARFIDGAIETPYVYVSLDLDVGSYNFTWAARYMDRPGIGTRDLLNVAAQIKSKCRRDNVELVGLDIMEFNMHFLGLESDEGVKDQTLAVASDWIVALASD
jgi:arginase family enzyme